jgi:NAD(P)-dependent dehydrogenase (short-subunit alcohol dehydrogenase family)
MDEVAGKVAVITGAASGIGRGLASVLSRAGMKVALADIEVQPLGDVARELAQQGADVFPVVTDVAEQGSVFALADAVHARYGTVHVLCNNAGVGGATSNHHGIWKPPIESWRWMLGVNLMGVVHGLQAFVPRMLDSGEEGHIVNTSSVMGVWSGSGAIYNVSKHALTALTEGLYHAGGGRPPPLDVSLLLPGLVASRINTAARNWAGSTRPSDAQFHPELQRRLEEMEAFYLREGMPPERVGEIVLDAIRERRFYVFTHPGSEQRVRDRMQAIIEHTDPPSMVPARARDSSEP